MPLTESEIVIRYAPFLSFHPQEGAFCCYPSDAEAAYQRVLAGQPHPVEPRHYQPFPCYTRATYLPVRGFWRIQYWVYYNHNNFPAPVGLGDHEADWEYVEVIANDSNILYAFYSNHSGSLARGPQDIVFQETHRLKSWVGLGSHANHPEPCALPPHSLLGEKVEDGGVVHDTRTLLVDFGDTTFSKANFVGSWANGGGIFSPPQRSIEENMLPIIL